jgi:hypothetical protein
MEENVDARKERKKQRDRSFKEVSKSLQCAKVGTRYFFLRPASAGPLFRNSASALRWSAIFKNLLVR